MTNGTANIGSIGVSPGLISSPGLPTIVSEWAALLPLVVHLASYQDDYVTAGDISLFGGIPISIFPALGTFSGIARLLEKGTEYLDFASTKGGSSRRVWDVNWGSAFPLANGAASTSIISFLLKKKKPNVIVLPTSRKPAISPSTSSEGNGSTKSEGKRKYRPQILNVYDFSKADKSGGRHPGQAVNQWRTSIIFEVLLSISLVGLSVFLAIFGAFGTAIITLLCAVSKAVAQSITFERPVGYLKNNEAHDACMLVAAHENAMEWHLFTGDRGIVDTLLNKPMILLPDGKGTRIAALWFRCADIIQLMAMTFVAAQKGWDGVCLVLLLAVDYAVSWLFGRHALTSNWLEQEHVDANIETFEFSGRSGMIGAIQVFSGSEVVCWMDEILVPHPRRDFWLTMLELPDGQSPQYPQNFSTREQNKVELDLTVAKEGAKIIKNAMSAGKV